MNRQFRGSKILIGFIICSILLLSCTGSNTQATRSQNNKAIIRTGLMYNINKTNKNNLKESKWQEIGNARFSPGGTDNEKIAVTPSGTIYLAYADYTQHNKLSVMRYDEPTMKWVNFGANTISTADASDISMVAAPNGSVYIAFTDAGKNNKATVMTYDNTSSSWKTVGGDAISNGKAAFTNIIVDANSTPYLAYSDLDNGGKTKVVTYDKNSNTWKAVGTFATTAKSEFNSMAFAPDGTLYITCSMYDFNMGRALVAAYDKSTQQWKMVGDIALSNGIAQYTSIAISPTGVPYITFADQGNDGKAKVMAYDKAVNHWRVVGNAGISVGSSQYNNISIAPDGKVDIVFKDAGSDNKATAIYFDATTQQWKPLAGNSALISEGEANHISLALSKDGTPYITYADNSADGGKKTTVMGYVPIKEWHYLEQPGFIRDLKPLARTLAISSDGALYTAFTDTAHNSKTSVMVYNKITNQWQYVGNPGFNDGQMQARSLAIAHDGTVYFTFQDGDHLDRASVMVYNKNTNQWQYLPGPGISESLAWFENISVAPDGTIYAAFADCAHNRKASVMTYNKNTNQWQYVGQPGLGCGDYAYNESLAIAPDGTLYITFTDATHNGPASVMTYSKSTNQWQYVGQTGLGDGRTAYGRLVVGPNGIPYLSFLNSTTTDPDKISVMAYY
jgi:hypothetical protein